MEITPLWRKSELLDAQDEFIFLFTSTCCSTDDSSDFALGCIHKIQNTAVVNGENFFLKGNRSLASLET